MKRIILPLLFLPLGLLAQNKKNLKTGWRTITTTGIVAGESDTRPIFQFSGGIVYKHQFAGIGIGYDMYQFNSFPVFADWRMSFGKRQIAFLYINSGYNFSGKYKEENEGFKTWDRLKGGFYMDAGVGYRLPLSNFNRLSFSAGYSRKNISRIKAFVYPCFTGDCPENIHEYKYGFGRIMAKMSWELGN